MDAESLAACWALLTTEERARADRMRAGPRERRVVAWARLREVLGAATGTRPGQVHLQVGAHGKPFVPGGPAFNLSHSEGLGLCALAEGREVGVDVEAVRPVAEAQLIAARWIGPEAAAALEAAGADRDAAFLRLWTRRESLLKGVGIGLAAAEELDAEEAARWSVVDLEPGTGYVGALAVARAGGSPSRGAGA